MYNLETQAVLGGRRKTKTYTHKKKPEMKPGAGKVIAIFASY